MVHVLWSDWHVLDWHVLLHGGAGLASWTTAEKYHLKAELIAVRTAHS
jgi:hypothetical protein